MSNFNEIARFFNTLTMEDVAVRRSTVTRGEIVPVFINVVEEIAEVPSFLQNNVKLAKRSANKEVNKYDLVVSDYIMPTEDRIELINIGGRR